MGHNITAQGLEKSEEKIEAILKAPEPKNKSEVRAFTGLINYYAKFIPSLAVKL